MAGELKDNICALCKNGRVLPDPDPFDWFCDDDEKIICTLDREEKCGSLRPYETDQFVVRDDKCPLKNGSI